MSNDTYEIFRDREFDSEVRASTEQAGQPAQEAKLSNTEKLKRELFALANNPTEKAYAEESWAILDRFYVGNGEMDSEKYLKAVEAQIGRPLTHLHAQALGHAAGMYLAVRQIDEIGALPKDQQVAKLLDVYFDVLGQIAN